MLDWFEYNHLSFTLNKIYNFKKTNQDSLNNFSKEIELKLSSFTTPSWTLLNSFIKASLENHVKKNKFKFNHSKSTPLFIKEEHFLIKSIKKAIKNLKNNLYSSL